jgi:hypothetical protein
MALRAVIWCAVSTVAQTADDKDSLPSQEISARQLCAQNGWQITDVLVVPGHSRFYIDIHECAHDMASKGIDAFYRLIELWEQKAFDVLVCRDFNRFARRPTLLSYIIERTIDIGARIHSFADGWVDEQNAAMAIALGGFKAKADITQLTALREIGMDKRLERGLSMNAIPMSHKLIFDERGKPSHLELDRSLERVWQDLATLLLEGVSWENIGTELYRRFGHIRNGKPYEGKTLHRLVHNPYFWGHAARHYPGKIGVWAFDESAPVPDGVKVNRNTHPPVWKAELAEEVKAELRRRSAIIRGRASPAGVYLFTGLLICDTCGHTMVVNANNGYPMWRCHTRYTTRAHATCDERRFISSRKVRLYVTSLLTALLEQGTPAQLNISARNQDHSQRIEMLALEIDDLKRQIGVMISKQAIEQNPTVAEIYTQQIGGAGERLQILHRNLAQAQSSIESPSQIQARKMAFNEIVQVGVDVFWKQDPKRINQVLHRLFGQTRLVVKAGEIIGLGQK